MRAALLAVLALACLPLHAADIVLKAAAFQRAELFPPGSKLAGATGWAEYDFHVDTSGWHELVAAPGGREITYSIGGVSVYDSTGNVQRGEDKVTDVWLERGAHTLRVERRYWTGFPAVEAFVLRPVAAGMRAALTGSTNVFRAHGCAPIEVQATRGTTLDVLLREKPDDPPRRVRQLAFDTARKRFAPPCEREGDYLVSFAGRAGEISWREQRAVAYEVIDPAAPPRAAPLERTLVDEIDLAARAPDYSSGPTRIVGGYRESGDAGFTRYQRAPASARAVMSEPSWFAYTLKGITPQQAHVVEIDYPDDALRTMVFALRESAPLAYPVAAGVDTGGEFALSRRMQTHSLLYWPRASGTRLVVLTAHDGRRAAAARVRVYRLTGALPALAAHKEGRRFVNYFEEGSNFLSVYGARDAWSAAARREALARWAEAARYMGVDTLMPTVSVYSFVLYPSLLQGAFSKPGADDLRRLLLVAEKYGLKVIAELHPRGDDLERTPGDPGAHLAVSRDGRATVGRVPPLRNALHPRSRQWYLAVIEELARRYADSAAFAGVSLRQMPWANPGFANLESLDWGYDAATLAAFERDTGLRADQARERWIAWRVERITELHAQALARIRAARKDLVLVAPLFRRDGAESQAAAWREAGVDPAALARLDGLQLLNAQITYGRREADGATNERSRRLLVDRARLGWMQRAGFLSIADYVEVTEAVARPEALGFPASTPLTWTSAAVTPAGRRFLERYALQLAETDAFTLGDGGNGYSLGQPLLRDWMREFRSLPARPFVPHPQARDPVALWTREEPDALLAYAVNRSAEPMALELAFSGRGEWRRMVGNAALEARAGRIEVALEPYGLLALRAAPGTVVREVRHQRLLATSRSSGSVP